MKMWLLASLGVVGFVGLTCAVTAARSHGANGTQMTHETHSRDASTAMTGVRFEAVDIFVDSGPLPLAAYQIEIIARFAGDSGTATLVGVEGGEHAEFTSPPYYDPAALHANQAKERIIIAGMSTAGSDDLPRGRLRVARLHLRVDGEARYVTNLMVAGGPSAEKITAIAQAVVHSGESQ